MHHGRGDEPARRCDGLRFGLTLQTRVAGNSCTETAEAGAAGFRSTPGSGAVERVRWRPIGREASASAEGTLAARPGGRAKMKDAPAAG